MHCMSSGPPKPQSNINISQIITNASLRVDLDDHSAAFPKPILFKVEKFGQPIGNMTISSYSTIVFNKIVKENAGTYIISTANYHLRNETEQIGMGVTNLTLDVLCKTHKANHERISYISFHSYRWSSSDRGSKRTLCSSW